MPIMSVSEFEAVLNRVRMKVEKALVQRPHTPPLQQAQRTIDHANRIARDPKELKAYRENVNQLGATLREELSNDGDIVDLTWDLVDFIDYRVNP